MIREVRPEDGEAIWKIYCHYVRESTYTFELEPPSREEMERRTALFAADNPYFVWEENGKVGGYCYAHPWRVRGAYKKTFETTIYLAPEMCGRGIGRAMMEHLIEVCRKRGCRVLIACITEENTASKMLHEKLGFEKVSHFKKVGEKFGRLLDVMDYELILS